MTLITNVQHFHSSWIWPYSINLAMIPQPSLLLPKRLLNVSGNSDAVAFSSFSLTCQPAGFDKDQDCTFKSISSGAM